MDKVFQYTSFLLYSVSYGVHKLFTVDIKDHQQSFDLGSKDDEVPLFIS